MNYTAPALDVERLADAYFAAWAARDPERIATLHTPDTRFQIHAGADPVVGRDAVKEAFAGLFAQWPNFAFRTHRTLYGSDMWVLDWDLLSSGGPAGDVQFGCLDVVQLAPDGLVARKDTYVNPAELTAALGGGA